MAGSWPRWSRDITDPATQPLRGTGDQPRRKEGRWLDVMSDGMRGARAMESGRERKRYGSRWKKSNPHVNAKKEETGKGVGLACRDDAADRGASMASGMDGEGERERREGVGTSSQCSQDPSLPP
ncbi:uncharacterized protein BO87DRAFT_392899 [Aspergillus neoniger CBS 115656]|uniref:Uncharacterized protein n=1 Tax=Aspergillus neoniger (strain CBS 115656) TaxID=1448310 RepID=A0A318YXH4_ASPNB|nr:hypothetical protein BO87DRAFT_392899 [Aspergillus neoniger CBS 115656]PYH39249.1 hypothetical protein BO87DRAFT_392899 [Aspergillus neoniger CBS 115656]